MDTETTIEEEKAPSQMDYVPTPASIELKKGMLYKEIIKEGPVDERPADGVEVFVHYIGCLTDGTEFDRSDVDSAPFSFVLGKGNVIKGWEIGVASMRKNEICKLYIHSELGYGERGSGKIPGNATLVFQIELIEWKLEDLSPNSNGAIMRKILKPGSSKYYHPNEGATVKVILKGVHEGRVFEEREVEFILGEGETENIVPGVEHALYKMSDGEESEIYLKPKYAFGSLGNKELGVPPDADVCYNVKLIRFMKGKEAWSLNGEEKLECAREFKEKGTRFFKEKKYSLSAKTYKKMVDFLKVEALLEGKLEEERKSLLAISYFNQAQCYLELHEYLNAKNAAIEGLELQKENPKGWYRRGLGDYGLRNFKEAKLAFLKVLEIEPNSPVVAGKVRQCDDAIKKEVEQEKKLYAKMFG